MFLLYLSVYHDNGILPNSTKIWLQFYRQAFSCSFCISVLNWNFSSSFYIKHTEIKIRSLWCVSPSSNQLGHVLGEPYCVPNYTIPVIGVRNGMACSLPWWYKYLHAVTAMTYTTSTYMPVLFQLCWFGACNFKREKLFVICYATSWYHCMVSLAQIYVLGIFQVKNKSQ